MNTFENQPTFILKEITALPPWQVSLVPEYTICHVTPPNLFHRLMQRLILGFKWEYIENETKKD